MRLYLPLINEIHIDHSKFVLNIQSFNLLISSNYLLKKPIILIDLYFIFVILLLYLVVHLILLVFFHIMKLIKIFFMDLCTIYLLIFYLGHSLLISILLPNLQIDKNPFVFFIIILNF